jgi:hypothetical protein
MVHDIDINQLNIGPIKKIWMKFHSIFVFSRIFNNKCIVVYSF